MNILITGGAGYLGSVLIPEIIKRNHKIRILDIGYFGISHLNPFISQIDFIQEDIRKIYKDSKFRRQIIQDCDCIIHLAAISNDSSCELNPKLTEEINIKATEVLAETAKKRNIKFIFSSSCSVYGYIEDIATEESSLNPLTLYALSKLKAERFLNTIKTSYWKPIILRCATLFGYSPRMRFDLVINIFSLHATLYNQITIFGEGNEWRPFLHVKDCAYAFIYFAEKKEVKYDCYNLACDNMKIMDLARLFKKLRPSIDIIQKQTSSPDNRNYRVSTIRVTEEGFIPSIDISMGAKEIMEAINKGLIDKPESIRYCNVKWLKKIFKRRYEKY